MRIDIPMEKLEGSGKNEGSHAACLKACQIHPNLGVFLNKLDTTSEDYKAFEAKLRTNPEDRPYEVVVMPRPAPFTPTLAIQLRFATTEADAMKLYEDTVAKWQDIVFNYPDEYA